ncbi:MAG: hypothetical protein ACREIQ_05400 [Nitrospiria bacterium]
MADLPELDQHDRPAATTTIVSAAFSIAWLQRGLDTMHQEFPWAGTVASASGTISALNTTNVAPSDFILDVRNGLLLNIGGTTKQLIRRSFADIMMYQALHNQGGTPVRSRPSLYCFTGRTLRFDITPDQDYTYTLWYYQMPSIMAGTSTPNFPSDHVLIDYVYIRALEWARKVPQGSAMKYLREVEIPALREAGLSQEPESDHIPLDPQQFRGRAGRLGTSWSGWEVRA